MIKKLLIFSVLLFLSIGLFAQRDTTNLAQSTQYAHSIVQVSAYPNPFKSHTKISFVSTKSQHVYFEVKNILGKSIFHTNFVSKEGINEIILQRDNIEKGMYIYTLQTDNELISKRLVVR